ncbi:E3 ubiquitin-protein ligase TRIM71-like [Glandiceps talaboti]
MAAVEIAILDKIGEDFLCCSVCLEHFTTPKILPCLHNFCQKCLVPIVERNGSLECPTCGNPCRLPDLGVPGLTTNFFMNNLIEIFKKRVELSGSVSVKCDACKENTATKRCVDCPQFSCDKCVEVHKNFPALRSHRILSIEEFQQGAKSATPTPIQPVEHCSVHHDNQIKFYCDTCKVAVCMECTIVDHRVPDHKHRHIKQVADEYKTELAQLIAELKKKERDVDRQKVAAVQTRTTLTEELKKEEKKVKLKAEEMINQIRKEENRLIDELNRQYTSKMKSADVDVDELELNHGNIKSTCSYIETLMHHGSHVQLLTTKKEALHRIKELIAMETKSQLQYERVEFQPSDGLQEHGMLGLLRSDICISECTVENIPKQLLKGDHADLSITTRDSTGKQVIPRQEVKAKVRKPNGSHHDVMVTDNKDGTHKVTMKGDISGRHQVTMTTRDQPIPGSPCEIPVNALVKTIGEEGTGDLAFNQPFSVTLDKHGNFVTADTYNHRIQITSKTGRFKKVLKFTQFKQKFTPYDIAISSDDEYFSTDNNNKQVIISDVNGHVVRCFGETELKGPYGIAISTDPRNRIVYVVDFAANCIRMYRYDSICRYIGSFGSKGSGPGQFNWPYYLVISQGMLFVTDCYNHRVQVFTMSGQFLYSFGCKGTKDGQLKWPRGIAVDKYRYLYVSDSSRIQKFDSSGQFVCRIDSDEDGLNSPYGIALTDDEPCRIVVADLNNHCLKQCVNLRENDYWS